MAATVAQALGGVAAAVAGGAATATPVGETPPFRPFSETGFVAQGGMGYNDGVSILNQLVMQRQSVLEQVKADLTEMFKTPLRGNFPKGNVGLPTGGGLPKRGAHLPGQANIMDQRRHQPNSEEHQNQKDLASNLRPTGEESTGPSLL